ncbi:ribonuclease H2, subunit C [Lobosporangium transversale]|uniref:Ribonuclease H2, subunit C n=1 Tax=Lobosporangium transversale TaxID=64571 RepID=A0A1Y2H0B0_9FUNG|nr:ribonuclease H2, subunit C [Lobosporangium transversale]ORZ27988.1 ribonuclease H2, subunit C [Lobosporangium transversale]|eukprot:XP_021885691.1 ribonuclease H2, subunit C [Lobosporangium transversale]
MESILEQPVATLPSPKQLDHTTLHLLPCGIHHDGNANIKSFFFLVDGEYPPPSLQKVSVSKTTEVNTATTAVPTLTPGTSEPTTITTATTEAVSTIESIAVTKPSVPEVSFRGRTLKGTVIQVPEGYKGSIYKPYEAPVKSFQQSHPQHQDVNMEEEEYEAMLKDMQEDRKRLRTEAQFDEFMVWGHDEQPTYKNEKVLRAMQWFDIAKILHEPLC